MNERAARALSKSSGKVEVSTYKDGKSKIQNEKGGRDQEKYGNLGFFKELPDEKLLKDKVELKRVGFSITPELKLEFEQAAEELDMNLTEFLRRAGRAAKKDPDILHQPDIDEAEEEYKSAFRPSRWTFEEPTDDNDGPG
ncbi:MAG: hypothetical protein ACFB11_02570 [Paracoccaceae bacterium]